MFFQREYIREAASMTLNNTYRLDLPEHGLLTALMIRISGNQAVNLGLNGGSWRILDYISKIEILLDGSTICKSLAGDAVQALAQLDQGVTSPDSWRNNATNTQWGFFLLNFGRHMADTEVGLDLSKFKNVELRVTNTAGAAQFGNLDISVQAIYLRDVSGMAFKGYLKTEEWRNYTTVADETKYLDIPTEGLLRRVLLQGLPALNSDNVAKTGLNNSMDDIEFMLDSGVIRVYKGGIDDLIRLNLFEYGKPIITGGFPMVSADKGVSFGLGYTLFGTGGAGSQDAGGATTIPTIESARTDHTQKFETTEPDHPIAAMFSGLAYHNFGVLRFDYDSLTETWLNPEQRKTVELNIHTRNLSDAASGTNKIILDRYIQY